MEDDEVAREICKQAAQAYRRRILSEDPISLIHDVLPDEQRESAWGAWGKLSAAAQEPDASTTQLRRLLDLANRQGDVSKWIKYIEERKNREHSAWKNSGLTAPLLAWLKLWTSLRNGDLRGMVLDGLTRSVNEQVRSRLRESLEQELPPADKLAVALLRPSLERLIRVACVAERNRGSD